MAVAPLTCLIPHQLSHAKNAPRRKIWNFLIVCVTTQGSELSFCDSTGDSAVAIGSRKLFNQTYDWEASAESAIIRPTRAMSFESATG